MTFQNNEEKSPMISIIIFVIALFVVLVNLVSLFFPALLVGVTSDFRSEINPFELGAWAIPVLLVNIVLVGFGVLYYTKKIPSSFINSINLLLNFEVSKKIATIVILVLLLFYIGFTISDLTVYEGDEWGDFKRVEPAVLNWPESEGPDSITILHVKNFLLKSSLVVFQNIKIIPYIASISLLLLTYFFTVKLSKKRFSGLIAFTILLQSATFLRYDTVATYSNFWTVFYLLSLYTIYKRWYVSPISFILSMFSKPLTIAFLPMTLVFTYLADIPTRKKIYITISYVIIAAILAGALFFGPDIPYSSTINFDQSDFWKGFTAWAFMLRSDVIILVFLLPLVVGLFLASKAGIKSANLVQVLILGVVLSAPILAGFTDFFIQPYRFVPLIVFFAVGVGVLFSKKSL